MAKTTNYIPTRQADFYNWQQNLNTVVSANLAAWGIPTAAYTIIATEQSLYEPLFNKITNKGTRSGSDVTAHKVQKRKYITVIRQFVKGYLASNAAITPEYKRQLQITIPKTKRTKRAPVESTPFTKVSALTGALIHLDNRVDGDASRAGIHLLADGVEFAYIIVQPIITEANQNNSSIISFNAPAGPGNCNMRITSKKASFNIQLNQSQAGCKLFGFTRWINLSDPSRSSAWSALQAVVISN